MRSKGWRALSRHSSVVLESEPVVFAPFLVLFAVLLILFVTTRPLEASSCGGAKPCKCGDQVTSNYALSADLGPCSGHGLVVKSNVVLDCRGFQITGLGGASEQYGISLSGKPGAEISGATVKGCRVSRFHRGIRLRAASSSLISGNTASDNGDQDKHVGYGIDVSGASHNNILENNRVHGNADEGIHIGTGSHKNRFTGNTSADNYRENLYLLSADGNVFVRNTWGPGGVNSLYLKDSSGNLFDDNTFRGHTARIVGDARDNQFINNTFTGAALHFQPYKGTTRSPSNNRVTGGAITDTPECIRFTSSRGNVVDGTDLGACQTAVRSESPSGASDNTLVGAPSAAVTLDEGSTLNRGRRVSVHVKDAAGAPVAGAKVEGRDASGASMWTSETDASGATPPQVFLTESRVGTRAVPRPPFTLVVNKPGYAVETRAVPAIEGSSLTVSLRPE
jgi:parallel beta-helix repeat protein